MKIEITKDYAGRKKGRTVDGICPVEGARLMAGGFAKETGPATAIPAEALNRMSMAQLRAVAKSRKVPNYSEMDGPGIIKALETKKKPS